MNTNAGHKHLEKPAMENELPQSLLGKSVLCIGVGSGEELTGILKLNPERVVGIDISEKLLGIARRRFPGIEFWKMDMRKTHFPESCFDFVYSSLTLHYAKDWDALLLEIYRVIKPGGHLLFSTHHPEYWSRKPATGNLYSNRRGITVSEHTALLPGGVEIIYYNHRSVDSIRDAVEYAGFQLEKCFSPSVSEISDGVVEMLSPAGMELFQALKNKNEQSPLFLILKAEKISKPADA